jgi:hypothetical protein
MIVNGFPPRSVIGTQLADYGINVNLGGNVNLIGRNPLPPACNSLPTSD